MCDKRLASPYLGKTILLQNEIVAKQDFGTMILWQSNTLANWYFGKMIAWDTRWPLSKQTHCSKQTILQIGSRNRHNLYGRRPNPKVFDLHRSPNYVLLNRILFYWYGCAVLFAAPRVVQDWVAFYHHGCRDAGTPPCMNMLWSHALPIQVFHVKTVQPSLNFIFWSFYRFVLCDKRHCLQVLWLEAGTTHCKQANTIQVFES